jgi:hypothetical protein
MVKTFISGSMATENTLPLAIKKKIEALVGQKNEILVGDARGIDFLVQQLLERLGHKEVTVYSIYRTPRNIVDGFKSKMINPPYGVSERTRQTEKDRAMSFHSDNSLVIWNGSSIGSKNNILRATTQNKEVEVFLSPEDRFLDKNEIKVIK